MIQNVHLKTKKPNEHKTKLGHKFEKTETAHRNLQIKSSYGMC